MCGIDCHLQCQPWVPWEVLPQVLGHIYKQAHRQDHIVQGINPMVLAAANSSRGLTASSVGWRFHWVPKSALSSVEPGYSLSCDLHRGGFSLPGLQLERPFPSCTNAIYFAHTSSGVLEVKPSWLIFLFFACLPSNIHTSSLPTHGPCPVHILVNCWENRFPRTAEIFHPSNF